MSVFISSDWHLGHKLAAEIRGYKSVEEHDEAVLAAACAVLHKKSKLFILGDVAFRPAALLRIQEVPGVKALVLGNHDTFRAARYLEVFNDLHGALNYRDFLLTHVPSCASPRFRANLHGHLHDKNTLEVSDWHYNLVIERHPVPIPFEMLEAKFPANARVQEVEA